MMDGHRQTASAADHPQAVEAAFAVLDAHMTALNARNAAALAATLHFPHHRLSGGRMQVWVTPDSYLADFHARAGTGWHRSAWDFRNAVAATPEKVHIDVQFTRYRANNSVLGQFRSLWVIARLDDRWGAQLRSSFAA